jgi:hypothetical protein
MKKNFTIPLFIFSIIVTILAVLLFIFFLKVIKNKNEHTGAVLATLSERMKEKENTLLFAEKVAETKKIQDSVNSHFVDPNKISMFVDYLEGIGSNFNSNVSVVNIEITPKSKNTISVRLSVKGKFEEVMKTVSYLENIPYQIEVTELSVNKNVSAQTQGGTTLPAPQDNLGWQADVYFNILSLE